MPNETGLERCPVPGTSDMTRIEVDESCRGPGNDGLSKARITTCAIDPGKKTGCMDPGNFPNGSSLDLPLLRSWTLVTVAVAGNRRCSCLLTRSLSWTLFFIPGLRGRAGRAPARCISRRGDMVRSWKGTAPPGNDLGGLRLQPRFDCQWFRRALPGVGVLRGDGPDGRAAR